MKKTISILALSMIIIFTVSARPNIQTSFNLEYSFDTNIFSNPLPMYEEPQKDSNGNLATDSNGNCIYRWLTWRADNPFIRRHSLGGNIGINFFIHETDRVGFSAMVNFKVPLATTSIIPEYATEPVPGNPNTGFGGEWEYKSYDSKEEQKIAIFGSFGPIFMAQLPKVDLGVAVRLSLGTYDYTTKDIVIGIQAEPFAHFYMSDHSFFNLKLTYDAHLMRFIESETEIFDQDYQMVSIAPSFGIGVRF